MKHIQFLAAAALGALLLAGCSGGDGARDDPTPTPSHPATTPPTGSGNGAGPAAPIPGGDPTWPRPGHGGAGGDSSGPEWTTGPLTVTHDLTAPPIPQLVGIRSAAHPNPGYDRIVFDFTGSLPGYTVRYVDEVREEASDQPVAMPGRRYLLVVFTPAQAHTDTGQASVSPRSKHLNYPMMRGYALVGDFEAYVSVAIGLDDVVGYRVGELPGDPGRIYLDVAA